MSQNSNHYYATCNVVWKLLLKTKIFLFSTSFGKFIFFWCECCIFFCHIENTVLDERRVLAPVALRNSLHRTCAALAIISQENSFNYSHLLITPQIKKYQHVLPFDYFLLPRTEFCKCKERKQIAELYINAIPRHSFFLCEILNVLKNYYADSLYQLISCKQFSFISSLAFCHFSLCFFYVYLLVSAEFVPFHYFYYSIEIWLCYIGQILPLLLK